MKAESTRKSPEQRRREEEEEEECLRWLASFRRWWEPHTHDSRTGAGVGGHPEAFRKWVTPEGKIRWFGIRTETAFLCNNYWQEFLAWRREGEPLGVPYTGNAAPREKIRTFLHGLRESFGIRIR